MAYAEGTTVPFERSRAEIEQTLKRYGATSFAYEWKDKKAVILFEASVRHLRFELAMPTASEFEGTRYASSEEKCAAEMRRRWRCLALVIKAKLEAVQSGIAEFEEEFLAHIILPNGETAGEWMKPQIAMAYETGKMSPLLTGGAR